MTKKYGLRRRRVTEKEEFNKTFCQVQRRLAEPGYRTIWHQLETGGLRIPIVIVQDLSKEMDPEGSELRKKHRLKRRRYQNPGLNYAWHIDGYVKLKQLCFPVHSAIEGFSRRMMWLKVGRSNNSAHKIAIFFVQTGSEHGVCPVELITDLGAENGLASSIQTFFRDNPDAHQVIRG